MIKIWNLVIFLNTNKVDIALITETWLQSNTNLNLNNYNIISCDSPLVIAGGLAIIINRSIKYYTLPFINVQDCKLLYESCFDHVNGYTIICFSILNFVNKLTAIFFYVIFLHSYIQKCDMCLRDLLSDKATTKVPESIF